MGVSIGFMVFMAVPLLQSTSLSLKSRFGQKAKFSRLSVFLAWETVEAQYKNQLNTSPHYLCL